MYDPTHYLGDFNVRRTTLSLLALSQQILTPVANRVGLIFTVQSASAILLDIVPTVSGASGVVQLKGPATYEFWWERHGAMVTYPWFAFSSAGGTILDITEILFTPMGDQ